MSKERLPYSYHTFLYPFQLIDIEYKDFQQKFDTDPDWERDDMVTEDGKGLCSVVHNEKEHVCLDYQAFQYFTPSARKALFGASREIVSCYRLKRSKGGTYIIKRGKVEDRLRIEAIRLKVFNTGIAMIVFEMEYYLPEGTTPDQAHAAVKRINEWGRRLYPEFLLQEKEGFLLCADELSIQLADSETEQEHFYHDLLREKAYLDPNCDASVNDYLRDPIQLPGIITKLLDVKDENIEPAIDDRMFVCCVIPDKSYVKSFIHPAGDANSIEPQKHDWRFLTDYKTGCELYAVTNIDDGGSSCQNRVMLDQYFEEQLYLRWIEYGTIHAVTNHSMFCLTGDPYDRMADTINPFLIEYVQLCILTLAQRASLLAFDAQITDAIKSAQGKQKPLSGEMLDSLISLEEDFAIFQGQLLIQEATPQIQGIELYEKLQKMLFIPELEKNVQLQLNNLYQIAEANRAKQLEADRQRKAEEEKAKEEKRKQEQEKQEASQKRVENFFMLLAILGIASAGLDLTEYVSKLIAVDTQLLAIWCGIGVLAVVAIVAGESLIAPMLKKKGKKNE